MSYRTGPKIVTDGLVLCLDAADRNSYPGSGNTWYDLNNSYDANIVAGGSPTYRDIYGGVFDLDGTDDMMLISDPGSLGNFTVSCWVYPLLGSTGGYPCIIASAYPLKVNFMISYLNSNSVVAGIYNNNGGWTDLTGINVSGGWQCFSYTYNGSQTLLYRNSTVIRTRSTTIAAQSSNLGIRLGRRWDSADYWNGYISSVRIYDRALSSDEITQNYNATKGRFGL
jgi:hypothetical protein